MAGDADKQGWVAREAADGRVELIAPARLLEALIQCGLLSRAPLEALGRFRQSEHRGRGRPLALELGGERIVAKSMRRGGLAGRVLRERFLGASRARRLVDLHEHLQAARAPVPALAFVRIRRGPLGLVALDCGTREVEGALDGVAYLRAAPAGRELRRALEAAGRAVAELHRCGVEHADLNVRNVLLRPGTTPEAFLIDLEKSSRHDPMPRAAIVRNLERLARSAAKLGLLGGAVSLAGAARLVRAHSPGDWRELLRAAARRLAARAPFHRVAWRLFSSARSAAD
jgi:3-deoxy-D-manno-octulosonic acid kinase